MRGARAGQWRLGGGHVRVLMNVCEIGGRVALEDGLETVSYPLINIFGALSGDMAKVSGTKTATAIVAVRPGIDPMIVPAATPSKASTRFRSVNAEVM